MSYKYNIQRFIYVFFLFMIIMIIVLYLFFANFQKQIHIFISVKFVFVSVKFVFVIDIENNDYPVGFDKIALNFDIWVFREKTGISCSINFLGK